MVGVIKAVNSDELVPADNELIKCMLKEREEHARQQEYDYSHAFRRKTNWEMFRLSSIAMAMELVYAAETSFVSPILLKTGIDHKHMTMAWGLSPLIGFFLSPLLGSVSDRCYLKWGRRRPIITILSLGICMGLALVPYGKTLGILLGDSTYDFGNTTVYNNHSNISQDAGDESTSETSFVSVASFNYKYAAILTILGTVLLDFDADTCQTPARTYLLDMCTPEDQPRALTMFTLFAGVGGTIGYGIGGIDWETTKLSNLLGGNVQTVFGLVAVIFVICYLITVTTFREIPLRLLESDEMLRPLSEEVIRKEIVKNKSNIFYIDKINSLDISKKIANNKSGIAFNSTNYPNAISLMDINAEENSNANGDLSVRGMEEAADCLHNPPVTLAQYLKSIFVMPYSMKILALTNLICWMGHITYCLYFTDFVGEAVYHGNPMADHRSTSGQLYEAGIRFGCWGMSIYALSCSIYSLSVTKLMKWFGLKAVYIGGIAYYGVGMLVLGLWPTKWGVLLISTSAGVLYGTIFTMPFILVARYHNQNCFIISKGVTHPLKQTRGLGTDIAIISSMVFIAQFIVSLCMGTVVTWMETTSAILYASALFSFLAIISAMFILYI